MTQTERIPASAAARQATGTTSETCSWISTKNCQRQSIIKTASLQIDSSATNGQCNMIKMSIIQQKLREAS